MRAVRAPDAPSRRPSLQCVTAGAAHPREYGMAHRCGSFRVRGCSSRSSASARPRAHRLNFMCRRRLESRCRNRPPYMRSRSVARGDRLPRARGEIRARSRLDQALHLRWRPFPGDQPNHLGAPRSRDKAAVEEAATQSRKVMAHAQAKHRDQETRSRRRGHHRAWHLARRARPSRMMSTRPTRSSDAGRNRMGHQACRAGKMPAMRPTKRVRGQRPHQQHPDGCRGRSEIASDPTQASGRTQHGEEFLLMQQLGMEPIDCIRRRRGGAKTIGMQGSGTLTPGFVGDRIGVPGDPSADLKLLSDPRTSTSWSKAATR